jgi:hypothetical protein
MLEDFSNIRRRSITLEQICAINKSLTQLAQMFQANCYEKIKDNIQ